MKAAVAKGTKTLADLQQFELDHRETADQREHRWRREHILEELANDGARGYREFKDNPKSFDSANARSQSRKCLLRTSIDDIPALPE